MGVRGGQEVGGAVCVLWASLKGLHFLSIMGDSRGFERESN